MASQICFVKSKIVSFEAATSSPRITYKQDLQGYTGEQGYTEIIIKNKIWEVISKSHHVWM